MMVRRAIVLAAGLLVGAVAIAAVPPRAGESGEEARAPSSGPSPAATNSSVAAPAPAPRIAEKTQSGNPLWAIPVRRLSATRERPLFAPSRRPPPPVVAYQLASVPAPPPPKPAEPEKPRLELIGTIVGESDAIGVFFDQATRSVLRLKMGEAHEGWFLREVQRRDVSLEKGSQTILLALPLPKGGSAAPPQRSAQNSGPRTGDASAAGENGRPLTSNGGDRDGPRVRAPAAALAPPPAVYPQFPPAKVENPFRLELIRR
jgi:general secretion pathway protein N